MAELLLLLMFIIILSIVYLMVTWKQLLYTCKYCWKIVRGCDYEEHIGRICLDLPVECVFGCGECIARKLMNHHCQQQCNNAKKILLQQQQEHKFVINCIAVEGSD